MPTRGPIDLNDLDPTISRLTHEMLDWVDGSRSWTNLVMEMGNHGAETQVAIAQMDAAEVQKLSAAIVALATVDARRRG